MSSSCVALLSAKPCCRRSSCFRHASRDASPGLVQRREERGHEDEEEKEDEKEDNNNNNEDQSDSNANTSGELRTANERSKSDGSVGLEGDAGGRRSTFTLTYKYILLPGLHAPDTSPGLIQRGGERGQEDEEEKGDAKEYNNDNN